jgi:hypothetical protein
MTQTITISLNLKEGQEPYSNKMENLNSGKIENMKESLPEYDSLIQFFEQLEPSYSILSITNKVSSL